MTFNKLQEAVATKPLDEACQYIIYELKEGIVATQAGLRIAIDSRYNQNQHQEALQIAAQELNQTLQIINNIIVDIFLPRLQKEESQDNKSEQ